MKELQEAMQDFQYGWNNSLDQRDKSVNDRRFVDVDGAMWDGACGEQFKNKPKLEFDKISREINRIVGEYSSNPISIRFVPDSEDADEELANLLNDRFRNDARKSEGQEAQDTAFQEAVKGGFGAFRICTEYEDELDPDANRQCIALYPIMSADSVVFWDADASNYDKSDAKQCWVLTPISRRKFDKKYPGKAPFQNGELPASWYKWLDFDWYGDDMVYIAEYYEVIEEKRTRIVFENELGETIKYFKDEIRDNEQIQDEIINYEQVGTERVKDKYVEKALVCGDSYLEEPERIAGRYIPIIPFYGYRSFIDGVEYYMGEVRKQRDSQTFTNMAMSNLADLLTESQKEKDIFLPEQVARHAQMWADNNVENYPYMLVDGVRDGAGNLIQAGPVGKTSAPQVPPALIAAMQFNADHQAQELGTGELKVPSNTSGEAIAQVQERADMSYFILLHNARKSMKYAAKVWLSIAKEIYGGVERPLRTLTEDGKINVVDLMQAQMTERGIGYKNDLSKGSYEIVAETGPAYTTRLEAERATLMGMLQVTDTNSPMYPLIMASMMQTVSGPGSESIKQVARLNELQILFASSPQLAMKEAKTPEEQQYIMQMMEQAMQPQQPDPMMQIAMIEAETKQLQAQSNALRAQNDMANTQIKAATAEADINLKGAQTVKTFADVGKTQAETQDISAKRQHETLRTAYDIQKDNREYASRLFGSLRTAQ
jgi:hypothetical protein